LANSSWAVYNAGEPQALALMSKNLIIVWIVLGVFLWGTIHAVGAYVNYTLTDNPWRVGRAIVVLLFVEGFLAFWLVLLLLRRRQGRNGRGGTP
jgi:hypothetical protein